MQRGVQDLTPDNEAKDPIVDRRSSSEFGYRSPSMTPSVRSPTRESVPQSPSAQSARSVQTNRSPGQRRISMPSITESPSPADIPPMPRQSCDLGRTPQSTEPLVRSSGSVRSKPTRNHTLMPLTPDDRTPKTPTRDLSDPTMNKSKGHSSRGMKRSHTTLGGSGSGNRNSRESSRANANANGGSQGHPMTTSSTHKLKRRKSMESAGFLSPQSAAPTQRRKSFDQITDLTRGHLKSRRSSDASTASQGTASSGSSGTSHTSVSDHTLESNRDRHGQSNHHNSNHSNASTMTVENPSVHELPDNSDTASVVSVVSVVSVASIAPSPPLSRSLSQPLVEQVKRRKPLPFAMDSSIRQSLDLQRLMSNQDRTGGKAKEGEVRNESDSDLPGVLSRRRTMETAPTRHGTLPRYNGVGHVVEAMSRASISEENPSRSQQLRFQQSTSGSSTSLQDMAQQQTRGSGHGASASYSGSGTVTGRLSRMWSSSSSSTSSKESVSGGTWNAGEFGDASSEAATQALVRTESNRLRGNNGGAANGGMLNRLSGLWSRR
ncbi:hypothetical protein BGX34_010858 [Mortierella sp. NVP85]|nr:hypothetical protein BGX34_010858 [Mortierella sp. NVP85]